MAKLSAYFLLNAGGIDIPAFPVSPPANIFLAHFPPISLPLFLNSLLAYHFPIFMLSQLLFAVVAAAAIGYFTVQMRRVAANIRLGRPHGRTDNPKERIRKTLLVAFGQQKMFKNWIPAVLHLVIYVSFLVINIELLEIVIDGLFGTHRFLGHLLGPVYDGLTAFNETLGVLVVFSAIALLYRRNVLKIKRFEGVEMQESRGLVAKRGWSYIDANLILVTEIVLMKALFIMNTADLALHGAELPGTFPISSLFVDMMPTDEATLHLLERTGWWIHIIGIFAFLNYLPYSKHFHIIMAFPNVYFSRLEQPGQFANLEQITHEVKAAMDYSYQVPEMENTPHRFGVKDIPDLSQVSLFNAYACTECGRCTAQCPANQTGKKLSPRKVIMDVRDRMEEIQKFGLSVNENGVVVAGESKVPGAEEAASHTLLNHYISEEELRACTTCNACVEACPVNIDHVSIITGLRQHLFLEDTSMPEAWGIMANNIETAGNPWGMPSAARFDWANEG